MRAAYVEPKKTPVTFEHAVELHRWALKGQLGVDCSADVLALFMGKTGLETGRYQSIYNGNFGNRKKPSTEQGMFTCFTLNEVLNKKLVWFAPEGQLSASPSKGGKVIGEPIPVPDGHPQTRMEAFPNVYEGIRAYAEFLANGRYRAAWVKLLAGDTAGYVRALKAAKYFTADESLYLKGVTALQKEYLSRLRGIAPPPKVDLEWEALKLAVPRLQFDVDQLINGDFEEAA